MPSRQWQSKAGEFPSLGPQDNGLRNPRWRRIRINSFGFTFVGGERALPCSALPRTFCLLRYIWRQYRLEALSCKGGGGDGTPVRECYCLLRDSPNLNIFRAVLISSGASSGYGLRLDLGLPYTLQANIFSAICRENIYTTHNQETLTNKNSKCKLRPR